VYSFCRKCAKTGVLGPFRGYYGMLIMLIITLEPPVLCSGTGAKTRCDEVLQKGVFRNRPKWRDRPNAFCVPFVTSYSRTL